MILRKGKTMSEIIGINGSPRKGWNTDLLVQEALKGAESKGAKTELVHLYDLNFKGCISCFECKRVDGNSLGHCALNDDLKPLLAQIEKADGLIIGAPIYFGEVTACVRALIERLMFQYITYRKDGRLLNTRRKNTMLIFDMNVPEAQLNAVGYTTKFTEYENLFTRIIGPTKSLYSTATLQTNDYGKYDMSMFDEADRKKRHNEVFPKDLQKAFSLGAGLV
jgi:multimeric flavodoxin WrbA